MLRRSLQSFAVCSLLGAALCAGAEPYRLTFELDSDVPRGIGGSGWPLATLPVARYSVQIDLDRPAIIERLDGGIYESTGSNANTSMFRADPIDNQLSNQSSLASDDWRLGQFVRGANQNAWGTGPTYATFDYRSRLDLVVGEYSDAVIFQGFWNTEFQLTDPFDLLTPGALWMVTDYFADPAGQQLGGAWFAHLVSIERAVVLPIPGSMYLTLAALAAAAHVRRRSRCLPASCCRKAVPT